MIGMNVIQKFQIMKMKNTYKNLHNDINLF